MLDKSYLEKMISSNFPDLDNTKFELNSQTVSSFTLGKLLPFLVYQNTIDLNRRLIGLYLPDNNSSNLLPFYVIVGQYRKLLDSTMKTSNYQSQSFNRDEIQVTYQGTILYVSSVDFINRKVKLISGKGELNLRFQELYKLDFLNKPGFKLSEKIDSFEKADKAQQTNIFTFPLCPKESQYEGVIIFTNVTKFESLIKNIKVSGNDLRDHLNIEKVVFPSTGGYKYTRLSSKHTQNKPISVLVARSDSYNAYKNILEFGGQKYNHIKTIIIDEFDEMLTKWTKSDNVNEELNNLKRNCFHLLNSGTLKDIYLICKNRSLNVHEVFKKFGIDYNPWLIKPFEASSLNDETVYSPEISITNVGDSDFENLNETISVLISSWRELAKNNFCNGEILITITHLYELRKKLNSFHNPDSLGRDLDSFLSKLDELKNTWFISGQDYGLITETIRYAKKCYDLPNYKLNSVFEILTKKGPCSYIHIVSENFNEDDLNWMKAAIQSRFSNTTIIHSQKKDAHYYFTKPTSKSDIIFYLTVDKYILGNALGNILTKNQVFVLNNKAYSYSVNYSKYYQKLQIEVGSLERQYHLLNIDTQDLTSNQLSSEIIPLKCYEKNITQTKTEDNHDISEPQLNDWVEEIIHNHKAIESGVSENYIIFFDDNTFELLPEFKKMYLYQDEIEVNDIEKTIKPVSELEPGEQIILPKRGTPVKDILEQTLKKNEHFSHSIEIDLKWRILINNHIKRHRMDLNFFRRKLRENGFIIGSDQTVQNWIDGDTRKPDNFQELLKSLALLGIINSSEIDSFYNHNSELKTIQMKFVSTAIRKLVSRLNGIDIEYDENFTDELLNNFIDHIEIKRISSLHKL